MNTMSRTEQPISFASARQMLRALLPPCCVVHVGWGNGLGETTQWAQWPLTSALIVESEAPKISQLQGLSVKKPDWQIVHATVAAATGDCQYHLASNPSESGLLPPEQLRTTWPHLSTVAKRTLTATTLDAIWLAIDPLQTTNDNSSSHSNTCMGLTQARTWLFIDCLPALDILTGANALLRQTQVVCARCLLQDKAALAEYLQQTNWIELGWTESHHPAVGHSWFVQDLDLQQTQASHALADINKHLQHTETQLNASRDDLTNLASQLTAALDQNRVMTDELENLFNEKTADAAAKDGALAERDELAAALEAETLVKTQSIWRQRPWLKL